MTTYMKDTAARLDYSFDWTVWLAEGETISSHTVTVPAGITKVSDSETDGVVTVWLSGGTEGTKYEIDCTITTSDGRIDERSIQISVRDR